jgi:hypothetical protein
MATMPNGMTTGGGEVQEHNLEDSELLCELYAVLENFDVPEGLRDTIMSMIGRWEAERDAT